MVVRFVRLLVALQTVVGCARRSPGSFEGFVIAMHAADVEVNALDRLLELALLNLDRVEDIEALLV